MTLVDELYSPEDRERIKLLYQEDLESRESLIQLIGSKILDTDKILTSSPLDVLFFICSLAKFAETQNECQYVAKVVFSRLRDPKPLPYVLDDQGLILAEKTLIALSFFLPAMEYRTKRHGSPKPSFYREISKRIFIVNDQEDVAEHHEQWEGFLAEMFLC